MKPITKLVLFNTGCLPFIWKPTFMLLMMAIPVIPIFELIHLVFGPPRNELGDPNTVSFTLSLAGLLFSFFFMGWVFDKYFFPWLCSVGLREDPEVEAMIKELEAMS
ncbi:MAG: hypothetical protein ACPHP7_09050 [Planctomycetota bacterium]